MEFTMEKINFLCEDEIKKLLKIIQLCAVHSFVGIKYLCSKSVSDLTKYSKFDKIVTLAKEIPLLFLLYCLEKKQSFICCFNIDFCRDAIYVWVNYDNALKHLKQFAFFLKFQEEQLGQHLSPTRQLYLFSL